MTATIIAVIGTLAGAVVSGLLQHRAARSDRADARADQRRRDQMDATTALARALSDHRRAMWQLRDAQLTGQPEARVQDLLDESHRTRSEITDPSVRFRILFTSPSIRIAAEAATQATYRMRESATLDRLQDDRRAALEAHDALVDAAAAHLA